MRTDTAGGKSNKTFEKSFRAHVTLKADALCSCKRHWRGCAREVYGILDKLASNDPERFVYSEVEGIRKHCRKFNRNGKPPYGKRRVEDVLAHFRKIHAISEAVTRFRHGTWRRGFIVTPHDALFVREGNVCEFQGQLRAPGRWESDCVGTVWWTPKPMQSADVSAVKTADASADQKLRSADPSADENEKKCGPECGRECGPESRQVTANAEVVDSSKKFSHEFSHEFSGSEPLEPSQSTERTSLSVVSESDGPEESTAKTTPPTTGFSLVTDLTKGKPKTVREHFADGVSIHRITDGEIDKDETDKYGLRGNWDALLDCCAEVIEESGSQNYIGRKTNGDLMAKAMGLLKERRGEKAPSAWYAVAKKLRKSGGPSVLAPPETATTYVRQFEPEAILNDSCLSFYADDLRPFEAGLVEHAKVVGVPRTFRQAIPFIEQLSLKQNDAALLSVLDALRKRPYMYG